MLSTNLLQARKQNLELDLNANEKEIFCSLNFDKDEYVQDYQKQKAIELAELYALGGEEASDKWKSAKYEARANGTSKLSIPNSSFRTANVYDKLGWFTSTRLAALRVNRVSVAYGTELIPKTFSIGKLTIPSSIGGLSNGLELAIDLGVIIKSLVSPAQGEKALSLGTRFKNILTKDGRHFRMLNAALWFSLNLSCMILTGGVSVILNLMGFSADVVVEGVKAIADIYRHHKLLRKVENRITEIDKTLSQHEIAHQLIVNKIKDTDNFELLANKNKTTIFRDDKVIKEYEMLCAQRDEFEALKKERNGLLAAKSQLHTKIKTVAKERLYSVAIAVTVLVGMALFFFPPAQLAVIGAFIALAAGSVMAGFCRRVWNTDTVKKARSKVVEFFVGKKPPQEVCLAPANKLSHQSVLPRSSSTSDINKVFVSDPQLIQQPVKASSQPKNRYTINLFNRSVDTLNSGTGSEPVRKALTI